MQPRYTWLSNWWSTSNRAESHEFESQHILSYSKDSGFVVEVISHLVHISISFSSSVLAELVISTLICSVQRYTFLGLIRGTEINYRVPKERDFLGWLNLYFSPENISLNHPFVQLLAHCLEFRDFTQVYPKKKKHTWPQLLLWTPEGNHAALNISN